MNDELTPEQEGWCWENGQDDTERKNLALAMKMGIAAGLERAHGLKMKPGEVYALGPPQYIGKLRPRGPFSMVTEDGALVGMDPPKDRE